MAEWNWERQLQAVIGYLELEMPEAALRELNQIDPKHHEELAVLALRLNVTMALKNWSLAAQLARHLVTVQPEDPSWWINLAYSVRRSDSIESAEAILLQALKPHPDEAMLYFNLACYACVTGRLSEATERLRQAIAIYPSTRQLALEDEDLLALRDAIPDL